MTLTERLVPLLRSIAQVLKTGSLHIGLTKRDMCISFLPERAVGPKRLLTIIERIGLDARFFTGPGGTINGAAVLSSGSQGAYKIHASMQNELIESEPQLIRRGKFPPMMWIVIDQHEIPVGEWSVLPFVVDIPVYLNGQLLSMKHLSPNMDSLRQTKRFSAPWKTDKYEGVVYYNPDQGFVTILHGDRLVTLADFPSPIFVSIIEGPAPEDYSFLMQEIAKELRAKFIADKKLLRKWDEGHAVELEEFTSRIKGKSVVPLLDGDYESVRMLLLLLGMGIREQITDFDLTYRRTVRASITHLFTSPLILDGCSRMASALLPDDIPVVANENAPPYTSTQIPRTTGLKVASLDVDDLLNVWFSENIHVGDHQLPYLFVDPASSVELETGEIITSEMPSFIMSKGELPIQELWWKLTQNERLLKTVALILMEHSAELVHQYFGVALSRQWSSQEEWIDYPLFAMLLLQLVANKNSEERAYTIQGGIALGNTSEHFNYVEDEGVQESQITAIKARANERRKVIKEMRRSNLERLNIGVKQ